VFEDSEAKDTKEDDNRSVEKSRLENAATEPAKEGNKTFLFYLQPLPFTKYYRNSLHFQMLTTRHM
jgi:hypothetical protein